MIPRSSPSTRELSGPPLSTMVELYRMEDAEVGAVPAQLRGRDGQGRGRPAAGAGHQGRRRSARTCSGRSRPRRSGEALPARQGACSSASGPTPTAPSGGNLTHEVKSALKDDPDNRHHRAQPHLRPGRQGLLRRRRRGVLRLGAGGGRRRAGSRCPSTTTASRRAPEKHAAAGAAADDTRGACNRPRQGDEGRGDGQAEGQARRRPGR